eukprot:5721652-Pyramimonas_sp.AAC.2
MVRLAHAHDPPGAAPRPTASKASGGPWRGPSRGQGWGGGGTRSVRESSNDSGSPQRARTRPPTAQDGPKTTH